MLVGRHTDLLGSSARGFPTCCWRHPASGSCA